MMDEEIRQALTEVREMKQMCGNINMKLTNIVTQRGQNWKAKLEAEYHRGLEEGYERGLAEGKKAFDLLDAERDAEYQRGLDDAWEAAKKISLMSPDEIEKVFPGAAKYNRYNLGYSGIEAIEKLKAYEEKQKADDKIKVRDEVIWTQDESAVIIVTSVYMVDGMEWCDGVCRNGRVYTILTKNARKTGRHFDIASILKEMQS